MSGRVSVRYKPILLLALALLLCPGRTVAGLYSCDKRNAIAMTLENPAERERICTAAEKANEFLARYDLHPQRTIKVNVVETSIENEGYDAFGSYNSLSEVIDLMSYQAIFASVNHPEMYGEPFDDVHYSGLIAHEIAHAVMHHNLTAKHISPTPQEYLAHATQLAVMSENRRSAIIKAMDVGPWQSGDAISDIYMALDPGKFAVKSYLHLTTMEHPKNFIRTLLNSKWFYVYVP
jgi:hypothetical protein